MTAPTMEQMLDAYVDECSQRLSMDPQRGAVQWQMRRSSRAAILARFAELERERDEARAAAEKEFGNVMALSAARDAYRADAERYEVVRCMTPRQFQDAWTLNLRTGKPFDEIIDDLRPFAAIAQRAGETG